VTSPGSDLLVVYAAYVIATGSPGPSTMAIMGTAMAAGRARALALAAGVLTGSMAWAAFAGTGLSVVLASYAQVLVAIKVLGGCYLLYLAWCSARSAWRPTAAPPREVAGGLGWVYLRGLLFHLTNPKAILSWIAVMSLGLSADASPTTVLAIIGGCAVLGACIFGGYALAFSTAPMVRLYGRARRGIEGMLAGFFAFAGIRLLLARS
jgi:threonine efflux protein